MENQDQNEAAANAVDHTQAPMPANHVEQMEHPSAILHLGVDTFGKLVIAGLIAGDFSPATNVAHAFMETIREEHDYLMSKVLGKTTDADRFRALRDFAVLANTDVKRFDQVNGMLQRFEESSGMTPENAKRTEADQITIANFLVQALIETAPDEPNEFDAERVAAAEDKRQRRALRKALLGGQAH